MVKIRLKYVKEYRSNGTLYYYYRRAGQLIPLPKKPLSQEFRMAYEQIHASFERGATIDRQIIPGSLRALFVDFQASPDWAALTKSTKRSYKAVLDDLQCDFGQISVADIRPSFVAKLRDTMANRPRTANLTLAVLRRTIQWGLQFDYSPTNPAVGIRPLKYGVQSHPAWSKEEVERLQNHPNVSPMVKLAVLLGLYTGQRIGDICATKWEDYEGGLILVVQEKTGERLAIPAHKNLRNALAKHGRGIGPILKTATQGVPMKRDYLSRALKRACTMTKIEGRTFHGLRKSAAVALCEAGVSDDEIKAITGHKTEAMVRYYTKGAKQLKKAKRAMDAWEDDGGEK